MRPAQTCVDGLRVNAKTLVTLIISSSCHFKNDLAVYLKCAIIHNNNGDPAGINYPFKASQNLIANQGFFHSQIYEQGLSRKPCAK